MSSAVSFKSGSQAVAWSKAAARSSLGWINGPGVTVTPRPRTRCTRFSDELETSGNGITTTGSPGRVPLARCGPSVL
jgi:hypothetical protein